MNEVRAPAREALNGDLLNWAQYGWCEVVERSNGPDPVVIRSDEGRIVAVAPGEVVEIRHLWVEPELEPATPMAAADRALLEVAAVADREEADVEATFLAMYGEDARPLVNTVKPGIEQAIDHLDVALLSLSHLRKILEGLRP